MANFMPWLSLGSSTKLVSSYLAYVKEFIPMSTIPDAYAPFYTLLPRVCPCSSLALKLCSAAGSCRCAPPCSFSGPSSPTSQLLPGCPSSSDATTCRACLGFLPPGSSVSCIRFGPWFALPSRLASRGLSAAQSKQSNLLTLVTLTHFSHFSHFSHNFDSPKSL